MKAISIKQPWASLIVHGIKDIENRTWKCPTKYIGQRVLIHASGKSSDIKINKYQFSTIERAHLGEHIGLITSMIIKPDFDKSPYFGAIIGSVKIVGCTINYPSVWADRSKGCVMLGSTLFVNADAKPIYNWILAEPILFEEPIPAKGKLSFWESHVEEMKIECPECGCMKMAVVDHTTVPFSSYVHECQNCAYLITESDWNEVK